VDLIDHDPPDPGKVLSQPLACEKHLQGLGGGYEAVGRILGLLLSLRLRRVTMPDRHLQVQGLTELGKPLQHVPVQRP
jgi:hypothetical protein